MSAGMAGIIAAHMANKVSRLGPGRVSVSCECGALRTSGDLPTEVMTAHVAEELTKAGFGNVKEALLTAADEMPIETLFGADKASVWLRQRAHSVDPEGHKLVQAIHDRKTEEVRKQPWEEWQRTVLERLFEDLRPAHEALVSAGLIEPPLPADPRKRSLYLRKHRNTGPDKPIQEQRRRR